MKVRNFMYATMIACAFASCSKDDVIDNGTDAGIGKLVISAKIGATTKAVTGSEAENTTGPVTVFLYKGNTFVTQATITSEANGNGTHEFTELEAGSDYSVYAYANMSGMTSANANQPGTIIQAIKDEISASAIPMSGSATNVVVPVAGQGTANVDLIRNVARIDLAKVSLGMGYRDADQYPEGHAYFTYKGVSINNALTKYAADQTPVPYAAEDEIWGGYAPAQNSFGIENTIEKTFYRAAQTLASVDQEYDAQTGKSTLVSAGIETETFYVVPNASKPTIMLIEGSFTASASQSQSDSWYKIVVGQDGTVQDENNQDVKSTTLAANKLYEVEVIVAGPGSGSTGDGKPTLVVNTKVKAWDKVKQVVPVQ